ncbi:hypothetical protein [Nocardia sp. NPDC058480]|uniref:hypothetical protein n=1 Tax=Nocardia sp. NPDC058480 TaxID=3346522 RepID=UPI00364F7E0C
MVGSVGHEQDLLAAVFVVGVLLGEMSLSCGDQIVFIGAAQEFTARAAQVSLHRSARPMVAVTGSPRFPWRR